VTLWTIEKGGSDHSNQRPAKQRMSLDFRVRPAPTVGARPGDAQRARRAGESIFVLTEEREDDGSAAR
jgi:hypothetical protein